MNNPPSGIVADVTWGFVSSPSIDTCTLYTVRNTLKEYPSWLMEIGNSLAFYIVAIVIVLVDKRLHLLGAIREL